VSLIDLPSPREEAWRWSDVSALPEIAARRPSGAVPDTLPWLGCDVEGPRLLFVDGVLAAGESRLGPIEIGPVTVDPAGHALARMVGRDGWKLKLGRDHAPPGLVQIIHVSTGGADHLPAEIELDVDAQASVVETYLGEGWINRLTGLTLGKGARLMMSRRLIGSGGYVSLSDHASVGEGASLILTTSSQRQRRLCRGGRCAPRPRAAAP
jgi:Fe-S cluster assembly protein SufD